MRSSLRAIVSRCVGVGTPSSGGAELIRSATCGASNAESIGLLADAPRSCWWLMQLTGVAPHDSSSLPQAVRHYAKAAATSKGAAAAAGGPKRHRTSTTKLYSCRNDRLRHTHEQIWPTLQLTEPELNMFRRNSRMFVVDMGRSISLQMKYRLANLNPAAAADVGAGVEQQQEEGQQGGLGAAEGAGGEGQGSVAEVAAAAGRKVPYQQARNLLYESNMHLDALGENPRYLKIRRVRSQFATKLQNMRKLRLLLGFQRRYTLQRMYEDALMTRGSHRMWKMVCAMESNLAMFTTRMGLAEDTVGAVYAIKNDKVHVNGRDPPMPYRGYLRPGDVVSPAAGSRAFFEKRVARSMQPLEDEVIFGIM